MQLHLVVKGRVQLEHSSYIQALTYIDGNQQAHLELCHRNFGKGDKLDCILNSTTGKCRSMQVVKQAEYWKASATTAQTSPSFQMNYD